MSLVNLLQLLCLAAIWGGSFLFMRIAAHSFGPAYLIEARVGFAALSLFLVAQLLRRSLPIRQHWPHFLILGLINTAVPFFTVCLCGVNSKCFNTLHTQLHSAHLGSSDWLSLAWYSSLP